MSKPGELRAQTLANTSQNCAPSSKYAAPEARRKRLLELKEEEERAAKRVARCPPEPPGGNPREGKNIDRSRPFFKPFAEEDAVLYTVDGGSCDVQCCPGGRGKMCVHLIEKTGREEEEARKERGSILFPRVAILEVFDVGGEEIVAWEENWDREVRLALESSDDEEEDHNQPQWNELSKRAQLKLIVSIHTNENNKSTLKKAFQQLKVPKDRHDKVETLVGKYVKRIEKAARDTVCKELLGHGPLKEKLLRESQRKKSKELWTTSPDLHLTAEEATLTRAYWNRVGLDPKALTVKIRVSKRYQAKRVQFNIDNTRKILTRESEYPTPPSSSSPPEKLRALNKGFDGRAPMAKMHHTSPPDVSDDDVTDEDVQKAGVEDYAPPAPVKRKRGRPKGSKTKKNMIS